MSEKINPEELKLLSWFISGKSPDEIAKVLFENRKSVLYQLDEIGIWNFIKIDKSKLIVYLYKRGLERKEIASILHIPESTLSPILREHGIKAHNKLTDSQKEIRDKRIIELVKDERIKSFKALSRVIKITPQKFAEILKEHNIENRFAKKDYKSIQIQICESFKDGKDVNQIAAIFDYSPTSVRSVLKKNNLLAPVVQIRKADKAKKNNLIIKEYKKGKSIQYLSRTHKMNEYDIWKILKGAGHYKESKYKPAPIQLKLSPKQVQALLKKVKKKTKK